MFAAIDRNDKAVEVLHLTPTLSSKRLSINAKTPFDELRVSGKSPLKSNPPTAQAELVEASFRRKSTVSEGEGAKSARSQSGRNPLATFGAKPVPSASA
jgi:hypothetical protein